MMMMIIIIIIIFLIIVIIIIMFYPCLLMCQVNSPMVRYRQITTQRHKLTTGDKQDTKKQTSTQRNSKQTRKIK